MSGDVALIDADDGAVSRLVRTATTLFDTPRFQPAALVGGLASLSGSPPCTVRRTTSTPSPKVRCLETSRCDTSETEMQRRRTASKSTA